ncbi:MAG TPA: AAA family ATPase [Herpetosiphonaceae bacterium]|nr:AAA family ATPase [Herpetosiphonaceae bacterium]
MIGSPGAGKSTFSRRLGQVLGREVIYLDRAFWRPGWVEPASRREWAAQILDLIQGPAWIMDGNYGGTLDLRLGAADTVIMLDLPAPLCTWRVLRRRIQYHGRSRPDIADGCPEKLSWEFVKYVWRFGRDKRPAMLRRLARLAATKQIIYLRSSAAIESFLERQRSANPDPRMIEAPAAEGTPSDR